MSRALRPTPEKIREVRERLNLDENNLRRDLSEAERQAADNPGLRAEPKETIVTSPTIPAPSAPVFPAWLVTTARILAPLAAVALLVLGGISSVPLAVTAGVFVLAFVASFIAGLSLPTWKGPALLRGTAAVVAGGIATALAALAATLPPGFYQNAALALAALLGGLAGVPIKIPGAVVAVLLAWSIAATPFVAQAQTQTSRIHEAAVMGNYRMMPCASGNNGLGVTVGSTRYNQLLNDLQRAYSGPAGASDYFSELDLALEMERVRRDQVTRGYGDYP